MWWWQCERCGGGGRIKGKKTQSISIVSYCLFLVLHSISKRMIDWLIIIIIINDWLRLYM